MPVAADHRAGYAADDGSDDRIAGILARGAAPRALRTTCKRGADGERKAAVAE
ncbi:MAG: hypothetical protein AMXMBFR72_10670 [Betaproteobacteria bacterium]|nr:MAG: hypothetical protein BroJett031_18700 [Betaproteobacteria bacterium]